MKASNLALSMKAARPDGRAGWEARARSDLTKSRIKDFLAAKLRSGFSRNTVRIIHAPLRAMLNAAVDDGAILANPANRLGRQLRLVTTPAARQEEIKAMTREQSGSIPRGGCPYGPGNACAIPLDGEDRGAAR